MEIKYRYTIAKFVPDILRKEFINIGVVIHLVEAEKVLRKWLPPTATKRLECFSDIFDAEDYLGFVQNLEADFFELPEIREGGLKPNRVLLENNRNAPHLLDFLYREIRGAYQFCKPIDSKTLLDAQSELDKLYERYAAPPKKR